MQVAGAFALRSLDAGHAECGSDGADRGIGVDVAIFGSEAETGSRERRAQSDRNSECFVSHAHTSESVNQPHANLVAVIVKHVLRSTNSIESHIRIIVGEAVVDTNAAS